MHFTLGSNVLCTLIFKLFQFSALGGDGEFGLTLYICTDTSHTPGEGLLFTPIAQDLLYANIRWLVSGVICILKGTFQSGLIRGLPHFRGPD